MTGKEIEYANRVSPECLLTPRQREVLQFTADGLTVNQTAKQMFVSQKTVETYRSQISFIGIPHTKGRRSYPHQETITLLALIQDGIINGYVKHTLPKRPVVPLSKREEQVLELVTQGLIYREIGANLYFATSTVGNFMQSIGKKIGTKNMFHTVARYTYLKLLKATSEPAKTI